MPAEDAGPRPGQVWHLVFFVCSFCFVASVFWNGTHGLLAIKHREYVTLLSSIPAMQLCNLCSLTIHAMPPLPFDFKSFKGQIMSSFVFEIPSLGQFHKT